MLIGLLKENIRMRKSSRRAQGILSMYSKITLRPGSDPGLRRDWAWLSHMI
jgi:hypothetical protein